MTDQARKIPRVLIRVLSAVTVAVLSVSMFFCIRAATETDITNRDIAVLLRYLSGYSDTPPAHADMNGDKIINNRDAIMMIQKYSDSTEKREYYSREYLSDFSEEALRISATAEEKATTEYTARYVDNGVVIRAFVTDPIKYTKPGDIGNGDNVSIHIQAVNSIARADRFAINFLIDADGTYMLRRYFNSSKSFVAVSGIDPTVENDTCYFTFTKTAVGYDVELFASYDFLRVEKEQAYGNVRTLISMRNTDSASKSHYLFYGKEEGISYDMPNTWLVIDKNNRFTRDDYDTLSFGEDILASNEHSSLEFLDSLATIEAVDGELYMAAPGASLFSDRTYCFERSYLPSELVGTAFLRGPIEGGSAKVTKAGYVVLLSGELSAYDTLNANITEAGWTRILYAAPTPYNYAVRTNTPDLANWYVKYCEAGETISLGKWSVPFALGETREFAWESEGGWLNFDTTDSYYSADARLWQGVPSLEVTNGSRIIAAWSTGDTVEGRAGNYGVLGYSDDNGATWNEIGYIDTKKTTDTSKDSTTCDVQLWLDRDTNTLYCFYIMSSTLTGFEKSSAVWMFSVTNPDDDISVWNVSEHRYLFPGLLRNNITVLDDGTWLAAPNNYLDERYTSVYASKDKGETWTLRGEAYIPEAVNYDETVITLLEDGTLWMTVRANTSKKAVYQSFSFDNGKTWTMSSPTDIFNCTTRFAISRLSTGTLVMVYNASSGRTDMTVALSHDDGATWQESMLIYAPYSTYPDISVLEAGGVEQIHIIFDSDRYAEGNIHHVVLTEEYIIKNSGKTYDRSLINLVSTLKDPVATVTGKVMTPDGAAVAGAVVQAGDASTTTDASGAFTIGTNETALTISAVGYYGRSYTVDTETCEIILVPDHAAYFGSVGGSNTTVKYEVWGLRYADCIRFVGIAERTLKATDHLELYSNVYSFTAKRTSYTAYTTFRGDETVPMKNFPNGTAKTHPNTAGVSSLVYGDTVVGCVPYTAWQAVCPSGYTVDASTPIGLTFLSLNGSASDPWTASTLGITLDATPTKKDSRTFVIWDADNNFYALSEAAEKFGLII